MSKKQNYLKMGSFVASLVLAVTFLATASAKADVVTLTGTSGDEEIKFATNAVITGKGYEYTQTFTLEKGSVFTKILLDPQSISMDLGHQVDNNGYFGTPAFDTGGLYDITVGWKGSIGIDTAGLDKSNNYGQEITKEDIKYAGELLEGVAGTAKSEPVNVSFEDLFSIEYSKDELAGISEITFKFLLEDISVASSIFNGEANINTGWGGMVNGLFYLEWEAAPTATPEPASLLICGMGAAGAGFVAYRKRRGKK